MQPQGSLCQGTVPEQMAVNRAEELSATEQTSHRILATERPFASEPGPAEHRAEEAGAASMPPAFICSKQRSLQQVQTRASVSSTLLSTSAMLREL